MKSKLPIGISLGDPAGIGPEITLKAISKNIFRSQKFILFGNFKNLKKVAKKNHLNLPPLLSNINELDKRKNGIINIDSPSFKMGELSKEAGFVAMESVKKTVDANLENKISAMVTAPISKQSILLAGHTFEGHTEYLQERAKTKRVVMMLVGGGLRVGLISRHISLAEVPQHVTKKEIIEVTRIVYDSLQKYWKIKRPKIGILGLNPHASDGGRFGNEEAKIIEPAIKALHKLNYKVIGPIPPDTAFHLALKDKWDAEICMYHDQGLIPLKTLAFDTGVNITLGLPFIRTSPDHGTAFDIAGKGKANESSMVEAIKIAIEMSKR